MQTGERVEAPSLEDARTAAEWIAPHVRRTPLLEVAGAHLKLENLQPTASFKVRGFFNAALQSKEADRIAGLLTVSAGNAALACAYTAQHLGVPCRVIMFDTAPRAKREGVERLGGHVMPLPFEDMLNWMRNESWHSEPEHFIHPFADTQLIAGTSTIALELVEDLPNVGQVIVPVGGGGLISGVSAVIKTLLPGVKVFGAQSSGYALWSEAFRTGGAVSLKPATICDGTTGPYNPRMHELLREHVDGWLVVPEERVRRAVAELAIRAKVVAEGAGALGFAALEQVDLSIPTVAVVSGGNIDGSRISELLLEAQP